MNLKCAQTVLLTMVKSSGLHVDMYRRHRVFHGTSLCYNELHFKGFESVINTNEISYTMKVLILYGCLQLNLVQCWLYRELDTLLLSLI